jgi:uncharacterized membrane protein
VVGLYADASGQHAFSLNAGAYSTIDFPGASYTSANAINSAGEIVGAYGDAAGHDQGFLLTGGSFSTIGFPGATDTVVNGINDKGEMTGNYGNSSVTFGFLENHGFTFTGGTFTSLDVSFAGVGMTEALGINNSGQVVGIYLDNNGTYFGFIAK